MDKISENHSTSSKAFPQSHKIKPGEPLSFNQRKASDDALKKRAGKEKVETTTEIGLRSCLSSAATPDILKQTPEITRHSIAVQVDILQNDKQETKLTKEQQKSETLLAELVRRNRDFEGCIVALQFYIKKVSHSCFRTTVFFFYVYKLTSVKFSSYLRRIMNVKMRHN